MALKATKPKNQVNRLKMFLYGEPGAGKTTAACQLPNPYIIDCERGTNNYSELINASGGSVYQTSDIDEVIEEVRQLSVEKHSFKTLVIDPISIVYTDLLEKMEAKFGDSFGKHYGEAGKQMKLLTNLLLRLDMNVVITAHAKVQYGEDFKKIGNTFEGWKRLPYIFDLVMELEKVSPTKRLARILKTRMKSFPDGESFEFTFEELSQRFNLDELQRESNNIVLVDEEQLATIEELKNVMKNGEEDLAKYLKRINIDIITDLSYEQANTMIKQMKKKLGVTAK
jgi:hypothetical protein